jgi:tetratricopeptide (TPR) repeat protein
MQKFLPILYLIFLFLVLSAFFLVILKQILQRQTTEKNLYELKKKVQTNQANYFDYYLLGTLYLSKKLFDQAILQFRYSLKLWDKDDIDGLTTLYNTLGFTYFKLEQYELAIYYYKESLKKTKGYVVALNNLGYAYEKQKMLSEAIEIYKETIKYDDSNDIARDRIKVISRRLGNSG